MEPLVYKAFVKDGLLQSDTDKLYWSHTGKVKYQNEEQEPVHVE